MAGQIEINNMALFCDFENIALGVRDSKYSSFDIRRVLERLLLKGSIVVKKAYCDWDRYKEFKKTMHEASFELIEIPHVRMSGKNSADIRMVVDALDLCYTKAHVDAFVIISGDSDFSPLVSKLRENNKYVIGIGVRDSTSDLLSANCDEFIFYDDLVRQIEAKKSRARKPAAKSIAETPEEPKSPAAKRGRARKTAASGRSAKEMKVEPVDKGVADKSDAGERSDAVDKGEAGSSRESADVAIEGDDVRRQEALDLLVETIEALAAERGDDDKLWGSMVKQTMKRRRPGFNEASYGYKSFRDLVDDAAGRSLLVVVSDERPGMYALRLPPA